MKIAIALRSCGSVLNFWEPRFVTDNKSTIIMTCLNSLLKTLSNSKHEILLSIHDDTSSENLKEKMKNLIKQFEINYQWFDTGKRGNFKSQYEWSRKQNFDFIYLVEDDWLHTDFALNDMIDFMNDIKSFDFGEYAIFPMNCPIRYVSPKSLYPCYVVKGKKDYWRTIQHSTATCFLDKNTIITHDDILRQQAYAWEYDGAKEDDYINNLWKRVRLFCPIKTLAWHISDEPNKDTINDWKSVWLKNYIRCEE